MNFDRNNVMLTSQYTFTPETYQCIGFSTDAYRNAFLQRSEDGAFVVVYLTRACGDHDAGCVVGVGQTNRNLGPMRSFTPLAELDETIAEVAANWQFAIGYDRAWRIAGQDRMDVRDFAPQTYSPTTARDLGARGRLLLPQEADRLLSMDFEEVQLGR